MRTIYKYFKFCSIIIIEKITMKYKILSVVRSVQMYWDFSTQNRNSAIALLGTQTDISDMYSEERETMTDKN